MLARGLEEQSRERESHNFYENHHMQIHFEKYLTRDLRQFTCFKQYFTKSVGPGQLSAEKLKVYLQTDGQTDELIWGGLGNLRFLQVKYTCCAWAGGTAEF